MSENINEAVTTDVPEKDPYEGYRGADGTIYDPLIYKKKRARRGAHVKRKPIDPETGRRIYGPYKKRKKKAKKVDKRKKRGYYLTAEEELKYQIRIGNIPWDQYPYKNKKKAPLKTDTTNGSTEKQNVSVGGTIVKVSESESQKRHIAYKTEEMSSLEKRKWYRENYTYEVTLLESGYSQKDVYTLSRLMGNKLSENTISLLKKEFIDN